MLLRNSRYAAALYIILNVIFTEQYDITKFITGVLLHGENLFNQFQFTGLFADASNNFDVN